MAKHQHEIRDPIHGFIHVDSQERKIVDSRPFQRLRHIHQLAMTCLLYPGATHRRFEHSLGVMELAGRVFDIVTRDDHRTEAARSVIPVNDLAYWRRVVRMAALCHDIGHLPFSHGAEKELLPKGWSHERITDELVRSEAMAKLWSEIKVQPEDVAKLALGPKEFGPKKHRTVDYSPWESILAEIVVGDAFGVDRMDYLLRDSHHAGVAYGRFDQFRLIDTLRILPAPGSEAPTLGIEEGGIHSVEALLLARYFMYTQVYFHHVRRIYDYHLQEFLKAWLNGGRFATKLSRHLAMTDNEVTAAFLAATQSRKAPGHEHARRIVERNHYRLLYERNPEDQGVNKEAVERIAFAAQEKFGRAAIHYFSYKEKNRRLEFPVCLHDGRVVSCLLASDVLNHIPEVSVEFVFIAPEYRPEAERWLKADRAKIIAPSPGDAE
jgi:HD superfamily phosphohydrolase